MKLQFYGAAREVTGSCHVLEIGGSRVLLDCGMIQGGRDADARNADPFPFEASQVDAVVLSHAHIDHSGRLPLLARRGFRGAIHTQNATVDLAGILLRDSANIAASQTRRENRYRERRGEALVEPLYEAADAERALKLMRGHRYGAWVEVVEGVRVRFLDAGHILGSAVVEVLVSEAGIERRLVFSGDLGQYDSPILRDAESPERADIVLMESTYGDRRHKDRQRSLEELGQMLRDADHERCNIVVPAFAVGRSQELLYQLGKHFDEWDVGRWHIFLDSPLAIEASHIYWDYPHLYDGEATRLHKGVNEMPPLPNLHFTRTADESRVINRLDAGAIIIAGSGMCNGGRILHHLKNNLENRHAKVLFTGYQPPGSLGRRIIDGAGEVSIHGRRLEVRAEVHTIGGLSAHGDNGDLLQWYRKIGGRPPVYLVHGDEDAMQALKFKLAAEAGAQAFVPNAGDEIDLTTLETS